MPYRASFAWAIIPLFDSGVTVASGESASRSSPLTTSMSGSNSREGADEPVANITLDGKLGYTSGNSVVVEVSNLNNVKEGYTEESIQDPRRKVHKPVKGMLRLEIEKLQAGIADFEKALENRSINSYLVDHGNHLTDTGSEEPRNVDLESHSSYRKELDQNGSTFHGNPDMGTNDVSNLYIFLLKLTCICNRFMILCPGKFLQEVIHFSKTSKKDVY